MPKSPSKSGGATGAGKPAPVSGKPSSSGNTRGNSGAAGPARIEGRVEQGTPGIKGKWSDWPS